MWSHICGVVCAVAIVLFQSLKTGADDSEGAGKF